MFIVISHMRFSGALSASKVYVSSTIEEAKQKAIEILKEDYEVLIEDEDDNQKEFKLIPLKHGDLDILFLDDYLEAYRHALGFSSIVTISKA